MICSVVNLGTRLLAPLIFLFAFYTPLEAQTVNHAKITSTENPFTITSSIGALFDGATAQHYSEIQPLDKSISWQVYLPQNYSPDNPPGLLVYISPSNSGKIPEDWQAIMDEFNLIWIGANRSGNNITPKRRLTYALLAPRVVTKQGFTIESSRVYLSGFSGGGRVASLLASDYPHIFKGAIYNSGANKWFNMTPEKLELMKNNRYVFIAGRHDFNLDNARRVYRIYKKAGLEHLKLKVINRMGHENPTFKNYRAAIQFVDKKQ